MFTTVGRFAIWYKVLSLLGVEVTRNALPAKTQCPACQQSSLHVYKDSILGGAWQYCSHCQVGGDMIELAARVWNCSIPQTIVRLDANDMGIPANMIDQASIAGYIQDYVQQRQRFRDLAAENRKTLTAGGHMPLAAMHRRGLRRELTGRLWDRRMGGYVGAAAAQDIDKVFRPGVAGMTTGTTRIFTGRKWKSVLAIPFYDLPYRLSGFYCLGREGKETDQVFFSTFRSMNPEIGDTEILEAGVCMADLLWLPPARRARFDSHIFVLDDPALALRMQMRALQDSPHPLPVISTWSAELLASGRKKTSRQVRSYKVWDAFPEKDFLFWSEQTSAKVFNTAARASGKVYIAPYPRELTRTAAEQSLSYAQRVALPWEDALAKALAEMNPAEADIMLRELDLPEQMMQDFRQRCSEPVRLQLAELTAIVPKAYVRDRQVTETEAGWFDEKTQMRIINARLRIDAVLYRAEDDVTFYRGRILYKDHELAFCEPAKVVEEHTLRWMRKQLLMAGLGVLQANSQWDTHLVEIATLLHEPTIQADVGHFGWRTEQSSFVLPHFAIHMHGRVRTQEQPIIDNETPGLNLEAPGAAPPALQGLTADTEISRIFWATVASIGANVLAPALNRPTVGIGLVGNGAVVVGRLAARACGCAEYKPAQRVRDSLEITDRLKDVTMQHAWPLVIVAPRGKYRESMANWFNDDQPKNILMDVDPHMANALGAQTDWRFIHSDAPLASANAVVTHGGRVLPYWLHDLAQRKLELQSSATSLAEQVLEDMAAWAAQYGDGDVVLSAVRVWDDVDEGSGRASRFVAMLHQFIADGTLRFRRAGEEPETLPAVLLFDGVDGPRGVFVSRRVVNQQLSRKNIPLPDPVSIASSLANAGALTGEVEYNDDVGWLIDEAWWNQQIELCRRHQNRLLRIVRETG